MTTSGHVDVRVDINEPCTQLHVEAQTDQTFLPALHGGTALGTLTRPLRKVRTGRTGLRRQIHVPSGVRMNTVSAPEPTNSTTAHK